MGVGSLHNGSLFLGKVKIGILGILGCTGVLFPFSFWPWFLMASIQAVLRNIFRNGLVLILLVLFGHGYISLHFVIGQASVFLCQLSLL